MKAITTAEIQTIVTRTTIDRMNPRTNRRPQTAFSWTTRRPSATDTISRAQTTTEAEETATLDLEAAAAELNRIEAERHAAEVAEAEARTAAAKEAAETAAEVAALEAHNRDEANAAEREATKAAEKAKEAAEAAFLALLPMVEEQNAKSSRTAEAARTAAAEARTKADKARAKAEAARAENEAQIAERAPMAKRAAALLEEADKARAIAYYKTAMMYDLQTRATAAAADVKAAWGAIHRAATEAEETAAKAALALAEQRTKHAKATANEDKRRAAALGAEADELIKHALSLEAEADKLHKAYIADSEEKKSAALGAKAERAAAAALKAEAAAVDAERAAAAAEDIARTTAQQNARKAREEAKRQTGADTATELYREARKAAHAARVEANAAEKAAKTALATYAEEQRQLDEIRSGKGGTRYLVIIRAQTAEDIALEAAREEADKVTAAALRDNATLTHAEVKKLEAVKAAAAALRAAEAAAKEAAETAATLKKWIIAADLQNARRAAENAAIIATPNGRAAAEIVAAAESKADRAEAIAEEIEEEAETAATLREAARTARAAALGSVGAIRVIADLYREGKADGTQILRAAETISGRSATNAVKREGTAAQYAMYLAKRAHDYTQQDLEEATAEAAAAIADAIIADPHELRTAEAALAEAAADLKESGPYNGEATAEITANAEKKATAAVYEDADHNRRSGNLYGLKAEAAEHRAKAEAARKSGRAEAAEAEEAATIEAATLAGYRAVNNLWTDNRSIRTAQYKPTESIEDIITAGAEPTAPINGKKQTTAAEAIKAAIIRAVTVRTAAKLASRQKVVFLAMCKKADSGQSQTAAAKSLNISEQTYRRHRIAIMEAFTTAAAELAVTMQRRAETDRTESIDYWSGTKDHSTIAAEQAEKLAAALYAITEAEKVRLAKAEAAETAAKATAKAEAAADKVKAIVAEAAAREADKAEALKRRQAEKGKSRAAAQAEAAREELRKALAEAAAAEALKAAIAATLAKIDPSERNIYETLKSGKTEREAAELIGKSKASIHRNAERIAAEIRSAAAEPLKAILEGKNLATIANA